ncbi:MAG: leucine-rich repeat protein [Bacteroidales bacterium]|nr:leucine-rich repeat protein [Bacteroidales bacterium]
MKNYCKVIAKRFLITLMLMSSFAGLKAQSYDFSSDFKQKTIYYTRLNATTVSVSSAFINCYWGKIEIPDTVRYDSVKYDVVAISNYAFALSDSLTEVKIPESVTTIGNFAFQTCPALIKVELTDSIQTIAKGAFKGCLSLPSIKLPVKLTKVSNMCFMQCKALDSVVISNNITRVDTSAFESCESLKHLVIDEPVSVIGKSAFRLCLSLNAIVLPNSVQTLEDFAFYASASVHTAALGSDNNTALTFIGKSAFAYCTRLIKTTVYSSFPPKAYDDSFTGVEAKHILHVPCNSKPIYDTTDAWKLLNDTVEGKEIVEDCTGLANEDFSTPTASLYPIPASNTITLEGDGIMEARICNLLGQDIISTRPNGRLKSQIDVSTLSKGMYIVRLRFADGRNSSLKLQIK